MKKSQLNKLIREEISKTLSEDPRPNAGSMMGKYIETMGDDGYHVIMSFSMPNEEELGLDYGTLDEIMEVENINGVKVYVVYI